mmetsp:Transcript_23834/g.46381  ORF Transcript_23834/g.46381 Transcript_23834/m.46381 type:complete len:119 (-) Transcript_23834:20-376(-)
MAKRRGGIQTVIIAGIIECLVVQLEGHKAERNHLTQKLEDDGGVSRLGGDFAHGSRLLFGGGSNVCSCGGKALARARAWGSDRYAALGCKLCSQTLRDERARSCLCLQSPTQPRDVKV